MLNINELVIVEDSLKSILDENLDIILSKLNRTEKLEEFLEMIDCLDLYPSYKVKRKGNGLGKVVIIAGTQIKEHELIKIAESLGINRNRLEMCLHYKDACKFNYKKMQYNDNYSLILFGQVPHSCHEKGEYSSIISAIENEEGYPNVIRLVTNNLKISTSNYKEALKQAIEEGIIKLIN